MGNEIKISFEALPAQLRTPEIRKFYDKDNSGFIESSNKNGINEYALFEPLAKSKGIDLSKYQATLKWTHSFEDNGFQRIEKMGPYGREVQVWKNEYEYRDTLYDTYNRHVEIIHTKFNKKGEATFDKIQQYKYEQVTKGKNNLLKVTRYDDGRTTSLGTQDLLSVSKPHTISFESYYFNGEERKAHKVSESYSLNGKSVQAKPIGKGRYEVTDKDGNVFYISHDGVNLKPEYVRNNP